jgi:predicted RNA binding protein YcfA (HicA-like mRNA interferase family)
MKYQEIISKLRTLGCVEIPRRGGSSHRKWYNPRTGNVLPIPDWGSKDLKIGTLRHIVRGLGLDWEVFKNT